VQVVTKGVSMVEIKTLDLDPLNTLIIVVIKVQQLEMVTQGVMGTFHVFIIRIYRSGYTK
jgi:hypothetical protein